MKIKAKKRARELRQSCKNAEHCGDCCREAMETCHDLCGYDNESLSTLDVKVIEAYLRSFKGYKDDI